MHSNGVQTREGACLRVKKKQTDHRMFSNNYYERQELDWLEE